MCPLKNLNGWPIGSLQVSSVLPTGESATQASSVSSTGMEAASFPAADEF